MLKSISPTSLLGVWFGAVAVIIAWSVAMDTRLSTSALLFVIGVARSWPAERSLIAKTA
jgi:hypothetical protein